MDAPAPSTDDDNAAAGAPVAPAPATDPVVRPGVTRVRDAAGCTGTVMYRGPVASAKDAARPYLGVAWDDPTRGRHNGTVVCRATRQLVAHFACPHPTGASFLLPHAVDFGRPLTLQVLRERYQKVHGDEDPPPPPPESSGGVDGDVDAPAAGTDSEVVGAAATSRGATKPIEFVGRAKVLRQQQLPRLTAVAVRSMGLSGVPDPRDSASEEADGDRDGDEADLGALRHLRQIDLAGNLLSDWADLERLLRQFPQLRHVSLAGNRLRLDSTDWLGRPDGGGAAATPPRVYSQLRHINLRGGVVESWWTLRHLLHVLPCLEEMCASANDLSDLSRADASRQGSDETARKPVYESMHWLDVSGCRIDHTGVSELAQQFPNLQWWSLDDNPIARWPADLTLEHLRHLQLANTDVSSWEDLEPLNQLPRLQSLRLRNCPLLRDLGELQTRSIAIARFPGLTKFNASIVTDSERQDAERHYLLTTNRLVQLSMANGSNGGEPNGDAAQQCAQECEAAVVREHPQYMRLLQKYPDLAARIRYQSRPTATTLFLSGSQQCSASAPSTGLLLADCMVSVTIRSMAAQSCTMDPLMRKLPLQLLVGRLKALCNRHFGLEVELQRLLVRPLSSSSCLPIAMTENDRSLEYYGVSDGAEILVHEMDADELETERLQAAKDLERRIQDQEAQLKQFQKQKKLATQQ